MIIILPRFYIKDSIQKILKGRPRPYNFVQNATPRFLGPRGSHVLLQTRPSRNLDYSYIGIRSYKSSKEPSNPKYFDIKSSRADQSCPPPRSGVSWPDDTCFVPRMRYREKANYIFVTNKKQHFVSSLNWSDQNNDESVPILNSEKSLSFNKNRESQSTCTQTQTLRSPGHFLMLLDH